MSRPTRQPRPYSHRTPTWNKSLSRTTPPRTATDVPAGQVPLTLHMARSSGVCARAHWCACIRMGQTGMEQWDLRDGLCRDVSGV
ncbi:hypothetical protein C8Q70DRAFT_404230 [Cubamyces menziesii]|nr:hypothetical protein C8Q70DRAFT_404230 [Cubamyces menziesii]